MKIHFERSGGFAGISTSVTVDSNSVSFEEQNIVKNMVDTARFFELPSETPLPKRGADYFKYKIRVETEEKSHTIKTNDMTMPSELRPLVNYLEKKTKWSTKGVKR
jgi:hypothetical protein